MESFQKQMTEEEILFLSKSKCLLTNDLYIKKTIVDPLPDVFHANIN